MKLLKINPNYIKMKKSILLHLAVYTFLFIAFSSCRKDDDTTTETSNSLDEISDIATFHGNLEGGID
jgi:hypothetical protein